MRRIQPRRRRGSFASTLLLLIGLGASACTGGSDHASSTTSTTSATTTTSPAAKVASTPTGDFVGLSFQSYEGEVSPSAGLRVLAQGCFDTPTDGSCTGSWYVMAPRGSYLLIATSVDFVFTVKHAYEVTGVPQGSSLHFAMGVNGQATDGGIIAMVNGASDASFRWKDIAGAWTVAKPDGGAVEDRPTTGLTVLDLCASYRASNGLEPAECTTPGVDASG